MIAKVIRRPVAKLVIKRIESLPMTLGRKANNKKFEIAEIAKTKRPIEKEVSATYFNESFFIYFVAIDARY